ncbi:MAG: class I SAM-dependent methyltransferase [Smithella sp.]|nr:class I SAM-dependent methyltransferase [Smithella sp.]
MSDSSIVNEKGAIQVDSAEYFTEGYCQPTRFASFSYQIKEVLTCKAKSVLEIGIGNAVVTYILRQAGLVVHTVDYDKSLKPDIVASVLSLPVLDKSYDAILCCQVLEHLSWDEFQPALQELTRVAKKR